MAIALSESKILCRASKSCAGNRVSFETEAESPLSEAIISVLEAAQLAGLSIFRSIDESPGKVEKKLFHCGSTEFSSLKYSS